MVQVSFDDALFESRLDAEPLIRQLTYARLLARRGADSKLSILVLTRKSAALPFTVENLRIFPVAPGLRGGLKLYSMLSSLHRDEPIDIITTQTILFDAVVAILFAWWHDCRVIGQIHYDLFSDAAQREVWFGRVRLAVSKFLMRYLFAVRTVSRRIARDLNQARLHWNVHVVPVPVFMALRAQPAEGRSGKRVLYVGRLVRQKGLDRWLRVAAAVSERDPEAEFHIVGDGPLRAELEVLVDALGLGGRVRFLGHIANESLLEVYRSARVLLLTSHYEGLCRVAVEAAACGVPVVGTRITGIEDLIDDSVSGYLHQPQDETGLATSVLQLLQHPQLATAMGRRAREDVLRRYEPERLAARWVDLWTSSTAPRNEP